MSVTYYTENYEQVLNRLFTYAYKATLTDPVKRNFSFFLYNYTDLSFL